MKTEDLEKKIELRAGAVVQQKIRVFKAEIDDALNKLFGRGPLLGCEHFGRYEESDTATHRKGERYEIVLGKLSVLRIAIKDTHDGGPPKTKVLWPRVLWDMEIEAIHNELLEKMDLMQQLLVSKSQPSDDDVPREF